MSNKLHCTAHNVRVMVLDNDGESVTVHRSNGQRCHTASVAIGNSVVPVTDVIRFSAHMTLNNFENMRVWNERMSSQSAEME